MAESTINQRLKFLMDALEMKAGPFSRALEVSETNIRNYTDRTSKPGFEVLEKIATTFKQVNSAWLLTGEGEPFNEGEAPIQNQTNISGKKNAVNVSGTNNGTATQNNFTLDDCRRDLQAANEKIRLLTSQLADKERTIQILMKQT